VVTSQTANWEREQGFAVFQNILQAHRDVDTVFACNDMMALGAVEAIAAAGRTGQIRVLGFDAVQMRDARSSPGRWRPPWRSILTRWAASPSKRGEGPQGRDGAADVVVRIGLVTKENAKP